MATINIESTPIALKQQGYRICTSRPDRQSILLKLIFDIDVQASPESRMPWPVLIEAAAY